MIGIIDYNAGNIKSVGRALQVLKMPYIISKNTKELKKCTHLIFPGDGEASYAMGQLKRLDLISFLNDWAFQDKPLLGICLGAQIIFDYSEEGDVECLGLVKGSIRHFSSLWKNNCNLKVPHIGWNDLHFSNTTSPLFTGIVEHSDVYFVHSYVIQAEDSSIITSYADYGIKVPASISYKNINAFQFHPEKSGDVGLRMLKNFCELSKLGEK